MKLFACLIVSLTLASCTVNDPPENQIPIGNFIYGTWTDTATYKTVNPDSTLTGRPTVRYTFNIDGSYAVTDESIFVGYKDGDGEFSFDELTGIISFFPDSDHFNDSLKLPHFVTKWQVYSINPISMDLNHQISIKDSVTTPFKNFNRVFTKVF